MKPRIVIPQAFQFLFEKARYKVPWGGRGSGKSESVARYLLIEGAKESQTILCTREYQTSIKDSVHQLFAYLINLYKLQSIYKVTLNDIRGVNGTKFIFAGLRHNIENIKSIPNIKKAWVEEAETVSHHSWDIFIPTIRGEDSEIIATFNPILSDAATYQRYVVSPPKDSIIKKVSYRDNPFFPDVLEGERLEMKQKDPVKYKNIWEGECRSAVEGAVFADEIRKAEEDGRIGEVPYNKQVPVCTYWDLGKQAMTAIWWIQYVGTQWRILKHYKAHMRDLQHFLKYVKEQEYTYDTHFMPHDATHDRLGMPASILTQARQTLRNVVPVPRIKQKGQAIDAAQQIFSECWFDQDLCKDGINDLRRYAFRIDPDTKKISKDPETTGYERDTADAFMTFAQSARPPKKKIIRKKQSIYITQ